MRQFTRLAFASTATVCLVLTLVSTRTTVSAHVPSGQSGFLLGGTAQNAQDPENPANQVIMINLTLSPGQCMAPTYLNCPAGTVSRKLNVKIFQLDNMLEFKSYFQNRSCGGGSPRIQLAIDLNGDGVADGNAFGYTSPPFTGCVPNRWNYDDLTDELPRWDLSQLVAGGFPSAVAICSNPLFMGNPAICPFIQNSGYIPWNVFETVLTTLFPLHKVCSGALVDDSAWFPAAAGTAYYDIISMGRATWEEWEDSVGRGFAKGCAAPDHADDDHDGDDNHDHCVDDGDRDWHQRHGGH